MRHTANNCCRETSAPPRDNSANASIEQLQEHLGQREADEGRVPAYKVCAPSYDQCRTAFGHRTASTHNKNTADTKRKCVLSLWSVLVFIVVAIFALHCTHLRPTSPGRRGLQQMVPWCKFMKETLMRLCFSCCCCCWWDVYVMIDGHAGKKGGIMISIVLPPFEGVELLGLLLPGQGRLCCSHPATASKCPETGRKDFTTGNPFIVFSRRDPSWRF